MQLSNVPLLRDVTPSGISTEVSPVHFLKAFAPIDVTLSGMLTSVSPVQFSKALSPIAVTGKPSIVAGISTVVLSVPGVTFVIVMLPFSTVYSNCVAVSGIALVPGVTLAGYITVSSDVQPEKA